MVPKINLVALDIKPSQENRQKTLDAVEQYKRADEELKRVCKEKGITVPEMVC